jgi:hypothetical protein
VRFGLGYQAAVLGWFRHSDRFEICHWSRVREAWRRFGGLDPLRLTFDEAHEIVENDPVFHLRDH